MQSPDELKAAEALAPHSVGVIGLGQMGRGIAANLDRAGYLAAAWDIAPDAFTKVGLSMSVANLAPAAMSERCDAVLFVLPASRDIEKCLVGPQGLLAAARPGQIIIDLTTSFPPDTLRLVEIADNAGRIYLDGGMSGGAMGADGGRLTLMMGGDAEVLGRCRAMLGMIAANIIHVGKSGAGHTVKLIHNMILHSIFFATAEGCRMAEHAGLDLATVIEVLNAGNARSFISEVRFPRHVLSGTFDGRSYVSTLTKDLGMAVELARSIGAPAVYGGITYALLAEAVAEGHGGDDFTRLYKMMDGLLGQYATQHQSSGRNP
jgi:3-hydroxyisobutyrate dehydrogenase